MANEHVAKCPSHGRKLYHDLYNHATKSWFRLHTHHCDVVSHEQVKWLSHEQVKCPGPYDG